VSTCRCSGSSKPMRHPPRPAWSSILTDCGTESTTWHEEAIPTHEVEKTCNRLGIKHTTTKVKHPWTNGYGERLNKTLLDEFYAVAF